MRLTELVVSILISAMIFSCAMTCFGSCQKCAKKITEKEKYFVEICREKNEIKKSFEK